MTAGPTKPSAPLITKSRLLNDFTTLGISAGDCLMLHLSVKSIGWLVGGPGIIITTLMELLGSEGTLMMYTGWADGPYTMEGWSAAKKDAYHQECPGFDLRTSRAVTEWSILTEILRTWPGTERSQHPDGSFCALGKQARFLTADHSLKYGYGRQSPLANLISLNGKIAHIGAPLNTVTLLHHAEDLAEIPNKRTVCYQMPVQTAVGGVKWVDIEEFDTSTGIVDWYEGDYFTDIIASYLQKHAIHPTYVGQATSYLFDAPHLNSYSVSWMEKKLVHKTEHKQGSSR